MILPVPFCSAVPVLNSKSRTAVQTAETEIAVLFHPDGFSVPHFNCLRRTFPRTQAAADAGVFHIKILRSACDVQKGIRKESENVGNSEFRMIPFFLRLDAGNDALHLMIRLLILPRHFYRIA